MQIVATHVCCLCLLTAAPECRPVACLHIYLLAVYGNYINMQNNEKRCSTCMCVCICKQGEEVSAAIILTILFLTMQ